MISRNKTLKYLLGRLLIAPLHFLPESMWSSASADMADNML